MSGEETFASGHRKMTNPFEKCARLQAHVAELEAALEEKIVDIVLTPRESQEMLDDWKGVARAGEVTIGELQARVAELEAKHDRTQAAIELIEAAGWLWFVGNTSDVWRDGSKLIRALVGTKENPLGEAEAATAAEALELAYTRAALQRDGGPG